MAFESLQALIATAVIDRDFCKALLTDSRCNAVANFGLTPEEMDAVMSIHAETLEQFAGQLHAWIMRMENQIEPTELVLPVRTYAHREVRTLKETTPALPAFVT
jgi:hypothetical protein